MSDLMKLPERCHWRTGRVRIPAYLERSLLPGVALATMLVKPILYLTGRTVSCMWLSCSSVNPDRNRHFPEMKKGTQSFVSDKHHKQFGGQSWSSRDTCDTVKETSCVQHMFIYSLIFNEGEGVERRCDLKDFNEVICSVKTRSDLCWLKDLKLNTITRLLFSDRFSTGTENTTQN